MKTIVGIDLPFLLDLPHDKIFNKKVFLRADLNISVSEYSARIEAIIPTLAYLTRAGASVLLATHLSDPDQSTEFLVGELFNRGFSIKYVYASWDDIFIDEIHTSLGPGEIALLPNLRTHSGEVQNSLEFAKNLSGLSDIYVNDAFAASHRHHASIVQLPGLLPGYLGIHFAQELEILDSVLNNNKKKGLVLGGAKFGTKLQLIETLLPKVEWILIGGALAHSFLFARGFSVGQSLLDRSVSVHHLADDSKIIIPESFLNEDDSIREYDCIEETDCIVDVDPEWIESLADKFNSVDQIIWNGPMGNYERGYFAGTTALVSTLSNSEADIIAGGGDTDIVLSQMDERPSFAHVSTGGGAMIEYLAKLNLVGLENIIGK